MKISIWIFGFFAISEAHRNRRDFNEFLTNLGNAFGNGKKNLKKKWKIFKDRDVVLDLPSRFDGD